MRRISSFDRINDISLVKLGAYNVPAGPGQRACGRMRSAPEPLPPGRRAVHLAAQAVIATDYGLRVPGVALDAPAAAAAPWTGSRPEVAYAGVEGEVLAFGLPAPVPDAWSEERALAEAR